MFNPVASYRYLLANLYLFVADIANPDLFACGSRTWISLDIARFYEEHCQPSRGSAWPACQKTVFGPHCLGREGSIRFVQGLPDRCDSSTVCRLCRLEPLGLFIIIFLLPHHSHVIDIDRISSCSLSSHKTRIRVIRRYFR